MKLTMLGTGNALVTECYNTCFIIDNNGETMLVDAGGGNTILRQLKKAGYKPKDIKTIYVTHKHVDHILGVVWMMRVIATSMNKGECDHEVYVYGHDEVIHLIDEISKSLLQTKEYNQIGKNIHLVEVKDGDEFTACGNKCVAFDINSTKAKQFGFTMHYDDNKLTCCGDEPFNECELEYAKDSEWLLHEAFCLYGEADIFKPYEKHHSTVKDACQLAEKLNVNNLVLYHSEDKNIRNRKKLYTEEGKKYYSGKLYVPEDLEVIEL